MKQKRRQTIKEKKEKQKERKQVKSMKYFPEREKNKKVVVEKETERQRREIEKIQKDNKVKWRKTKRETKEWLKRFIETTFELRIKASRQIKFYFPACFISDPTVKDVKAEG